MQWIEKIVFLSQWCSTNNLIKCFYYDYVRVAGRTIRGFCNENPLETRVYEAVPRSSPTRIRLPTALPPLTRERATGSWMLAYEVATDYVRCANMRRMCNGEVCNQERHATVAAGYGAGAP